MYHNLLTSVSECVPVQTRVFNAENPRGIPGAGGSAAEGSAKYRGKHLGIGYKYNPSRFVQPGETLELLDTEGPGYVQHMWFADTISRKVILRIWWDDQQWPSVECPLMEFFAYSWRKKEPNVYSGPFGQLSSLPVAVNPNRGFNSFWQMPFQSRCRIQIENASDQVYECFYQITCGFTPIPETAGRFHASFRISKPVERGKNHVILDGVSGRGRYVGTALFVQPDREPLWWGEGAVKIWLDEDGQFPTICGTGTEDYFGGAYDFQVEGVQTLYTTPFMGFHQHLKAGTHESWGNRYSFYRWHLADPICFEKSICVEIQDMGWEEFLKKYSVRSDIFASVAYWYQELPGAPLQPLPPMEVLDYD